MKISIQGEIGSFSHIAAKELYGNDIEVISRKTFGEVFEDLATDKADRIVVPIENSTYGSIYQNYDLLTKYDFHINSEIYLKVNFHLIVNPGAKLEEIKHIYSHPVALGQIRSFLEEHPNITPHDYPDTSGAVEMLKNENKQDSAAAASRSSAETFGMEIIQESIQENGKNYTRFYGLSKSDNKESHSNPKSTVEFELGEEAGSLYKALEYFHHKNISLTKIESRPIINTDWEYRFYLDFLGDVNKLNLTELKYSVKDFRVHGCYEKGEYVET